MLSVPKEESGTVKTHEKIIQSVDLTRLMSNVERGMWMNSPTVSFTYHYVI